jgi:hypothetical protein
MIPSLSRSYSYSSRSPAAASGLDADSILEESAKLGFPVWDERLRGFLKSQRIAGSREKHAIRLVL